MSFLQEKPIYGVILGVIVGIILGLIWGWGIAPVEWTEAGVNALHPDDQARIINLAADNYAVTQNAAEVQALFSTWPGAADAICEDAAQAQNVTEQQQLNAVAAVLNGTGCELAGVQPQPPAEGEEAPAAEGEAEESGGGNLGRILLGGLVLLLLVAGIALVLMRRSTVMGDMITGPVYEEIPEAAPVVTGADEGGTAVPIARFRTNYTRGHDAYDDSFSIENAGGDFLGECGVGISESIGTDTPKNVTAFEVWLFDKNDIRTITKVVMSDHAFFDDAIKAKLATKGEQVLSREGETIVLETASLIINAEITEMQYGTGTLPPQSYFETVTFELSAWAKEGESSMASDTAVDDVMDF